ncbi:hypothetical protein [Billgrantia endophytica]|uniref:DUF1127 domain-containing protein n=1 Tax=Billgrantia endophytica TaxID=2033802 RepID=A0A2N7U7Z6_9GAMM|nr:hypothetical protein [Halomonas endophytica]PMR76562.1 hypothetical protein C1H69_05850 [Halomonas endophytica]
MSDLGHTRDPQFKATQEVASTPPMPDLYMPAMPPLGFIALIEKWMKARLQRRRFNQRFLPLLAYDDHTLEDMGHDRKEILWASRLPLREDAAQALQQRRAQRRAGARQNPHLPSTTWSHSFRASSPGNSTCSPRFAGQERPIR